LLTYAVQATPNIPIPTVSFNKLHLLKAKADKCEFVLS